MANTSLRREVSVTGNRRIFTLSAWVKKTKLADNQNIFSQYVGSGSANIATHFRIRFGTTDNLQVAAGGTDLLITNRLFRDTNAWYHVVCAVDTTQGTADDRVKLYINGVQETSFATRNNPTQNVDTVVNLAGSSHYPRIGADDSDGNGPYGYFDGLMSHVHFCDGTALAPTVFGSTDSTTGEWKINTAPSFTPGTNGFTILKDGNTITDQSANSNNFTLVGGTLTDLEDCPSNVFATLNPVVRLASGSNAYSQGNNTFTDASGSYNTCFSTLGMFNGQGKYYAEFKDVSGTSLLFGIADHKSSGVIDRIQRGENRYLGEYANSYGYQRNGNFYYNGSSTSTGYASFTTNDIIGMAVDMDNLKIYWHKNGTYQNSKSPASNNGETIVAPEGAYHIAISAASSAANANFGNGVFGTTAISSEGTNASGIGKFEYDVPTGYTALSTKGLNL